MKVSELWLREWVNPKLTGPELAAQLTMAGLEVDSLHPVAGPFTHVVVAQVLRTTPHPEADKLTLCEIDDGSGAVIPVVCGAANVRAGLKVALARPGSTLPGGLVIKETKLRGQPSAGMLCSTAELGMEEHADGIMELEEDAPIGCDLRDYLQLNDHVFDVDLTPNRADCFSVLGVAREVAALNRMPLQNIAIETHEPTLDDDIQVTIQALDACPRYCARIIKGIQPDATTPLWMKERLRRSGIRVLHPVVDVTNYVMLELGQPMHAFDLKTIDGAIQVRLAKPQETLALLDKQELTLDETVLVIADDKKPLAMAGVMGGADSAVHADTLDICLESAFFNPITIAGVARRYGLSSDSSQRFERGVDPELQVQALERATTLLLAIVGGNAGPIVQVAAGASLPARAMIVFHPEHVKQLSGVDVPLEDIKHILTGLGLRIEVCNDHWQVQVPSHRFDINLDVDLVEEVIRLYGYDKIKAAPWVARLNSGRMNAYEHLSRQMASFLSHRGYHESISYSFVDPALQQAFYPDVATLSLLNPISSELSDMRIGLWPGLLASTVYNAHRQQSAIQLFEIGVVFDATKETLREQPMIGGLLMGEQGQLNWNEVARSFDFYDMKGDLQALFAMLNCHEVQFVEGIHPALHPGQSARIMINGVDAGWLGVLHPRLQDELDLNAEVILFELSLAAFIEPQVPRFKTISKYPQIRRDLSLIVPSQVSVAEIECLVREETAASQWLKSFDIFDVYRGDSIPQDKKSLAIALTLQDDQRTLVDAEINAIISAILKKLEEKFGATLRAGTIEDLGTS